MIVVRVELWSAATGEKTELARMHIANTGTGTAARGSYFGQTFRGRSAPALSKLIEAKQGHVENFPRQQLHVWNLVSRMLLTMGYSK